MVEALKQIRFIDFIFSICLKIKNIFNEKKKI